jgi:hypothetical protein
MTKSGAYPSHVGINDKRSKAAFTTVNKPQKKKNDT